MGYGVGMLQLNSTKVFLFFYFVRSFRLLNEVIGTTSFSLFFPNQRKLLRKGRNNLIRKQSYFPHMLHHSFFILERKCEFSL